MQLQLQHLTDRHLSTHYHYN